MSGFEVQEQPHGNRRQFEASQDNLSPEERCLADLFDMADVDKIGAYKPCSEFFVALNGHAAPADLRTNIHSRRLEADDAVFGAHTFPTGVKVVATVSVGFDTESDTTRGLRNIDFVQTEEGMKAYEKEWFMVDEERLPRYVRLLDGTQLSALAADAKFIKQAVVETDLERLKLGPLVEEAGPDGLRRFHIGDILSAVTGGRSLSARGVKGLYDILGYMTNDAPSSVQLGRFIDECIPFLREQFDEQLGAFYEPPEVVMADAPSVYRWLGEVARSVGAPLLTVKPIPQDAHAQIDMQTELELDHGSDFMIKKVATLQPEGPEKP